MFSRGSAKLIMEMLVSSNDQRQKQKADKLLSVQAEQLKDPGKSIVASGLKVLPPTWAALLANLREGILPLSSGASAIAAAELVHPFTRMLLKRPATLSVVDPKAARIIEKGSTTPQNPATPVPSGAPYLLCLTHLTILPGKSR